MSRFLSLPIVVFSLCFAYISQAQSPNVSTIEEYNQRLPFWGVTWEEGDLSANGYYPSFYTGFVMRSEFPERIHIRTARGNETRVSVILDQQTITDYLFDLAKRSEVYGKMTSGPNALLMLNAPGANYLPQLNFFNQILQSPAYGIMAFVQSAKQGGQSKEAIYSKSLDVLRKLNPNRVFMIQLNLKNEFNRWKASMKALPSFDVNNTQFVISSLNQLVFGRVNWTAKPTSDIVSKLSKTLEAVTKNAGDDVFVPAAFELFKAVTGNKYNFKVLNAANQWQPALQCPSAASCFLVYPEFTAIYPTGSLQETTTDDFGNTINSYASPGLWNFISRKPRYDVDHIRDEPFYGFIPKMDFDADGNGFHNPAVRFYDPSNAMKAALGMPANHTTLWAVKRGGVSHGCLRLPAGHAWELRHIVPSEDEKFVQVQFFGNRSADFDLYDIDGNGSLEVMGVEYLISYNLQGADEALRREGEGLNVNSKLDFYTKLYGANQVFQVTNGSTLNFINPKVSFPAYMDLNGRNVTTRVIIPGSFPLYEQAYEREKIQLYALPEYTTKKDLIRLMGRIRGCAPSSDKNQCGEAAFDAEAKQWLN